MGKFGQAGYRQMTLFRKSESYTTLWKHMHHKSCSTDSKRDGLKHSSHSRKCCNAGDLWIQLSVHFPVRLLLGEEVGGEVWKRVDLVTEIVSPWHGTRSGELEDHPEEEDEDEDLSTDEAGGSIGSMAGIVGEDGSSGDEVSDSSSEADSVFGSDLDGDDEDLGVLRKKAGRRGSAAR